MNLKSLFKRKPSREEMVEAASSLFTKEDLEKLQDPKDYDVKDALLFTVQCDKPIRKYKTLEDVKKTLEPLVEGLRSSKSLEDPTFRLKESIERVFYRLLFKDR